ncbi:MAG: hypothetical protein ACT4NU_01060 [Chromatiales bacterium]
MVMMVVVRIVIVVVVVIDLMVMLLVVVVRRLVIALGQNGRTAGSTDACTDNRTGSPAELGADDTSQRATDRTADRGVSMQILRKGRLHSERQHGQ